MDFIFTNRLIKDLTQNTPALQDIFNEILPLVDSDFIKFFESLFTHEKEADFLAFRTDLATLLLFQDKNDLELLYKRFRDTYPFCIEIENRIKDNQTLKAIILSVIDRIQVINNPKKTIENPLYVMFLQTYQEFENVPMLQVINMFSKIACTYPRFKDIVKSKEPTMCETYPFFMLVAHYLAIEGKATQAGFNQSGGVVSSSSIDGVSVSYAIAPYKDSFQYFFQQTPYGQEYLAWLASNNSMVFINNAKV